MILQILITLTPIAALLMLMRAAAIPGQMGDRGAFRFLTVSREKGPQPYIPNFGRFHGHIGVNSL